MLRRKKYQIAQNHPPAHGEAAKQLVAQRLRLCDGAQSAVVDLLRVQLHAAFWEFEALLHHAGQLPDAAPLLACSQVRAEKA